MIAQQETSTLEKTNPALEGGLLLLLSLIWGSAFTLIKVAVETIPPLTMVAARVTIAAAIGAALMFLLQRVTVAGEPLGPVGIAIGAGIGAWFELIVLRRSLSRQLEGELRPGGGRVAKLLLAATVAALIGRAIEWFLPPLHPIVIAVIVLIPFGVAYFGLARLFKVPEAAAATDRVLRRLRR